MLLVYHIIYKRKSNQSEAKENVKNIKKFALNGAMMTLCALLMRTVAVSFNVYVANTAGAEAVGLYSLLSSVYGFAITLALSGLHLAVTRLVSEALALGDKASVSKIMRKSFLYASAFGILSMLLLFSLSSTLAADWLGDIRVVKPFKILSICLPLISISSVINGYFSAVRRVYKSALSQLFEMAVKNYTAEKMECRGLGFVYVDNRYSQTGGLFEDGAIGHGGHTGQSVFLDYRTGLYVIVLSDATITTVKKYGSEKYDEVIKMREKIHAAIKREWE